MTDHSPVRRVPQWESDDFIAGAAHLAAVMFREAGWTWHGKDEPPSEARIALAIRRHAAAVKDHLNAGDYDYGCQGSGRIEVRHRDGYLDVMVEIGSLSIIDYDELERQEVEQGRAVASEYIAEMRSAIKPKTA